MMPSFREVCARFGVGVVTWGCKYIILYLFMELCANDVCANTETMAGPADLSGKLKAGDRVLSVNGTSIVDLSLDEITRLFPGPVGSPVFVAIDTGTMIRTVEV